MPSKAANQAGQALNYQQQSVYDKQGFAFSRSDKPKICNAAKKLTAELTAGGAINRLF